MSEFSHLKSKLLAEQVEEQIYHYILDTPFEPGAKLPNEFELGERFGVGRSTVREAVKLLSSKGIVEVRRGSGTYVVTTTKGLSDPLGLRSVRDKNALALDLVNVRLLLEPGIAEMAARNATQEDIERLRRLCERVEQKIHDGDRYIEDDIAFHTCIAESSKNLVVGQDKKGNPDIRTVLHLHPALAPFKAAVLPLSKKLSPKAEEIYHMLQKDFMVDFDDAGSIGKRYRREDEIGTPLCITVDFQTVGDENTPADNCVTVRDRDTMEQVRIPISELKDYISNKCAF